MDNAPTLQPATDASGFLPGPLGLRLDEEHLPIISLSARPDMLDRLLPFGQCVMSKEGFLLRLWPTSLWCIGTQPEGSWRRVDISHGMTHLRLRGVEAVHFLSNYARVDLQSAAIRQTRAVRTKLNQYDCVLWWPNTRDIHIVTERSVAQSLVDHLRALACRHEAADPVTNLQTRAPDAPDRRG